MIVLTLQQRNDLLTLMAANAPALAAKGISCNPIEIKNNLFIVGEEMLTDPAWAAGVAKLTELGWLQTYEIRAVAQSEFIPPPEI